MNRTIKLVLTLAVTLLAVTAFTGVANASTTITVTPAGNIVIISSGKLTFDAGGRRAECNVTMNGRMVTTGVRIAGGVIGEINEVRIRECNGEVSVERALVETPWTITSTRALQTAERVLPENYTGLLYTIRAVKFRFEAFFGIVRCLYEGDAGVLSRFTRIGAARYTIDRGSVLEESTFRKISGPEQCPATGRMEGSFNITRQTVTVG